MNISQKLLTGVAVVLSFRELGAQTAPDLKPLQNAVAGYRAGLKAALGGCEALTITRAAVCGKQVGELERLGRVLDGQRKHLPKGLPKDQHKRLEKALTEMLAESKGLKKQPQAWVDQQTAKFVADAKLNLKHASADQADAAYGALYNLGSLNGRDLTWRFDPSKGLFVIVGSAGLTVDQLRAELKHITKDGPFKYAFDWSPGDKTESDELTLVHK